MLAVESCGASWERWLLPPLLPPYEILAELSARGASFPFYRDSFVLLTSYAGFRRPPVLPWQRFLLKYRWECKLILNKVKWRRGWLKLSKAFEATQIYLSNQFCKKSSKANFASLRLHPSHNKKQKKEVLGIFLWTATTHGGGRPGNPPSLSPLHVPHVHSAKYSACGGVRRWIRLRNSTSGWMLWAFMECGINAVLLLLLVVMRRGQYAVLYFVALTLLSVLSLKYKANA